MEIVLDTFDLCWDFGNITIVDREGQKNEIKVIRPDGYTYYIATPDRDTWSIVSNITENDLPDDWTPTGYYYYVIDNIWIKREPIPTGSTENYL